MCAFADHEPLDCSAPLTAWLEAGAKPVESWKIGTEFETFTFRESDFSAVAFDGECGIEALLELLARDEGWFTVYENGRRLAVVHEQGMVVTYEPGGQIELSGHPVATIHDTHAEMEAHLLRMKRVRKELGIGSLFMGTHPTRSHVETPWMPKVRYRVMHDFLSPRGAWGPAMLSSTCSIQSSLDFESETDMREKMRLALTLGPVITALFAHSSFYGGRSSGFLSFRGAMWQDVSKERTGWMPMFLDGNFGFEHYTQHVLDIPMAFIVRNGTFLDGGGVPFRVFLEGRHPTLPGEYPSLKDWELHLSTLFHDVRLRQYIEIRGADGGTPAMACALGAFWVGLLYSSSSRQAAWDLVASWPRKERDRIYEQVVRDGLTTAIPGSRSLRELAIDLLSLAKAGLVERRRLDALGRDESLYLAPLWEIIDLRQNMAQRLLLNYHGPWECSIHPVFHSEEWTL